MKNLSLLKIKFLAFKQEFFNLFRTTPPVENLAEEQAKAWVEILRSNYSEEDQNEIIEKTIDLLICRREKEIVDTHKTLKSLIDTNKELSKLKFA